MTAERLHIWVGAAVAVAIPILALTFFTGDMRTRADSGYRLTAYYNQVDGVTIGTDVLLAGIPVGDVVGMTFDPVRQQVALTFSVRRDLELPRDTSALILSDGLLGGKYVKLEPGGELDMLRPGDRIEFVQDSVIVEELLQKVILWAEARRANDAAPSAEGAQPSGQGGPR